MKELARKNIFKISPYVGGKPIEETKRQFGLKKVVKLASNENPLGASPKAVEAIRRASYGINRYPDSQSFYLKKRLAKFLNVNSANLVLGNGSDELIDIVIKTFVEDDENIVTSEVTFLEYEILASVYGRKLIKVPLRYFKYDLESMKKKINKKTKLVFIANPNNPTGTYVTKFELRDFMNALPPSALLVIDEAYDAFIDVDDYPDMLDSFRNKNIIILKTFSKSYGLAGLRIGYAVLDDELAGLMERVRQPFNINSLAQAGAQAALDDKEFLRKTRKLVLEGKDYLYDNLKKLGLAYVPSITNFILVDVGQDGVEVFNRMLRFGVIVRDMKQYGLKNFIRVTIGTKKENERFIRVLKKILNKV
ncbi:MAG: histidinol-phosphate transaminase [Candidatus Omnitrophica bacterium]|nr:histidinol-phosphate transaminase [Candidatus Omnitrophota bacterium]